MPNEHQLNVAEGKKIYDSSSVKKEMVLILFNVATYICCARVINDNLHCFSFNFPPPSAIKRYFIRILTGFCLKNLMTHMNHMSM